MMVIGIILIIVTLMVMIGIFMKANQGIKIARAKGNTGGDLNSFGYKQNYCAIWEVFQTLQFPFRSSPFLLEG